jgi:hypothetical protein
LIKILNRGERRERRDIQLKINSLSEDWERGRVRVGGQSAGKDKKKFPAPYAQLPTPGNI